jgi:hypothetical protein
MFKNEIEFTNSMKKQVSKDWDDAFPCLYKDPSFSFGRIVGPLTIDIAYSYEYGVEYRPEFSVTNLCNVENGLYATLVTEPPTRRSSITWPQHEKGLYKEAVQQLKDNALLSIEGEITLSQVLDAYSTYASNGNLTRKTHEDPALIAAYSGEIELAHELAELYKDGMMHNIELGYINNKKEMIQEVEEWYQSLLSRLNTESLRKEVNEAIVKHKLTKLPRHELIIDC